MVVSKTVRKIRYSAVRKTRFPKGRQIPRALNVLNGHGKIVYKMGSFCPHSNIFYLNFFRFNSFLYSGGKLDLGNSKRDWPASRALSVYMSFLIFKNTKFKLLNSLSI